MIVIMRRKKAEQKTTIDPGIGGVMMTMIIDPQAQPRETATAANRESETETEVTAGTLSRNGEATRIVVGIAIMIGAVAAMTGAIGRTVVAHVVAGMAAAVVLVIAEEVAVAAVAAAAAVAHDEVVARLADQSARQAAMVSEVVAVEDNRRVGEVEVVGGTGETAPLDEMVAVAVAVLAVMIAAVRVLVDHVTGIVKAIEIKVTELEGDRLRVIKAIVTERGQHHAIEVIEVKGDQHHETKSGRQHVTRGGQHHGIGNSLRHVK